MNLFELFVKVGVDDQASGKLKDLSGKLGNGLKTAAKVGTAAVTAASGAIVALTKQSVESYAEYEQLVGGVETLYGSAYNSVEEYAKGVGISLEKAEMSFEQYQNRQQDVLNNAANAYKTAGMSANEYMDMVNGFAASLTNSLGEYEWQAASYADMIATDISDNANKMGSDLESLKLAYGGFAKGNFTMLDNLKLGYGGTKEEMERLLRKAEEIEGYTKGSFSIESFADIAEAINIVQTKMGITGTTAEEAGRTIAGSVGAMKAAWTNLLTGLANGGANLETLVEDLVTTIVGDGTENNLGVLGNIMPAVKMALRGAAKVVAQSAPIIAEELPKLMEEILPDLASATANLVVALAEQIPSMAQTLVDAAYQIVDEIGNAFAERIPGLSVIFENLETVVISLAAAFAAYKAATSISGVIDMLRKATEGQTIAQTLLNAVMNANPFVLVATLITGVGTALVTLYMTNEDFRNKVKEIWGKVKDTFKDAVGFIAEKIHNLVEWTQSIPENFKEFGKNIVSGLKQGISSAWNNLKEWFTGLFGDLKEIAKRILGISSPSKVFKQFGKFVDEGLAIGIRDNADVAYSAVSDLAKGVSSGFDVSLGTNYIGTYKTTSSGGYFNSPISKTDSLLTELISMFRNGTATTNVGNTRELRRAVNA